MGFTGGCLCGAIRYKCSAELGGIIYCHCRNCQIASGGAFSSNVMIAPDSLTITTGKLTCYEDTADSGAQVKREFCNQCGTAILSRPGPNMAVLKAGSIDDSKSLKPLMSIWEDSAQPWALKCEGITRFSKNPG